ncbi:MAG: hypothetical protein AMJ61_13870 [Desulfobacterales bacterium SG8_35_2]|nr:MAG: hypothetical protein AMJ61_13870 [Desulfobacterales bacterium SG8_35_2]
MNEIFQKLLLLITVISLFVSGCAGNKNYGTFHLDRGLEQLFLSYQVLPDYNYYTSGGYDKPNAILGVHKNYRMVTDFWVSIPNVNSAQIEKWIRTIDPEDRGPGNNYYAYSILDPEGKQVGFWYSIQNYTVVKFLEENKIEVYPPELIQPGDEFGGDSRNEVRIKFR